MDELAQTVAAHVGQMVYAAKALRVRSLRRAVAQDHVDARPVSAAAPRGRR
jgi:hypothetical protein